MKFKPISAPTLTQEQFDAEMAFAPRNHFFPTIEAFTANMMKRIEALKALEKCQVVSISKEFREDFLSRND